MQRRGNVWINLDWITVGLFLILIIMGWINIYAAVYSEQQSAFFDFSTRYTRQFFYIILAVAIALAALFIEVSFFTFFSYVIYALSILSLLAVLIFAREINGARSWFSFGWFNLQPAEFAKVAASLAVAKYISSYNVNISGFRNLMIAFGLILIPALLIMLQPDMGSAIVFLSILFAFYREGMPGAILLVGIIIIILFFAALIVDKIYIISSLIGISVVAFFVLRKKIKEVLIILLTLSVSSLITWLVSYFLHKSASVYYILLGGIALSGIILTALALRYRLRKWLLVYLVLVGTVAFTFSVEFVFNSILSKHQRHRINILLNIEQDPQGVGYNVNQSKIAIGSGGWFGKGYLNGTQNKGDFVPEQSTDFIFCTVGEEWGFAGSFLVLGLFLTLLLRMIFLAERQRSVFSRVFGYCTASILFTHVIINIGMTIGLLPVVGIPLPFFSYGGSSLWGFTLLLFVFLRLDASRLELLR